MRYEGSKYKIRSLKDTATLIREEIKEKMLKKSKVRVGGSKNMKKYEKNEEKNT